MGVVPGLLAAVLITLAAYSLSWVTGGPVMLFAIMLGLATNPYLYTPTTEAGIGFCAKTMLNIGVALLGIKLAFSDVIGLGIQTTLLVIIVVIGTIFSGVVIGRILGIKRDHAVLSSGAVAICGASAALAICAATPENKNIERNTLVTVMGVTLLGTFAMIVYPAISIMMGFSDKQAGIFIGSTIHNVAQVVGAGYMISEPAGDTATVVKLMRVSCLVPVIMLITLYHRQPTAVTPPKGRTLARLLPVPAFLFGFIALLTVNSLGYVSVGVSEALSSISKYALVGAIAALGMKTSLKELLNVGGNICILLVIQTILLAVFAIFSVALVPGLA